jgi:hypothetical protein
MTRVECEFESEVLSTALQGRWPDRVASELRVHAASCLICSDIVAVASALDEAREDMHACAVVPDSGRVWWLAQLRARREAAEAAGRPITAAQVIALAAAIGLLGACFGATSKWFQASLGWFGSSIAGIKTPALLPSVLSLVAEHGALVLAMAAVVLLVPAAVYFTMLRD